jgi:hypothetical protein
VGSLPARRPRRTPWKWRQDRSAPRAAAKASAPSQWRPPPDPDGARAERPSDRPLSPICHRRVEVTAANSADRPRGSSASRARCNCGCPCCARRRPEGCARCVRRLGPSAPRRRAAATAVSSMTPRGKARGEEWPSERQLDPEYQFRGDNTQLALPLSPGTKRSSPSHFLWDGPVGTMACHAMAHAPLSRRLNSAIRMTLCVIGTPDRVLSSL